MVSPRADDQLDRLSLHGAAPELGALQVSEDVDFAAELGGGGADDWNDPLEVAALPAAEGVRCRCEARGVAGRARGDTGRYGEIRGDVGRCGEMASGAGATS